jgi:hypothetical protein
MIRFAQQRKDCDTICQHICIIGNLRALFFFLIVIIIYLKKIPFFYGVILIKEIKP